MVGEPLHPDPRPPITRRERSEQDMFELRVAVSKVIGTCTSGVPMKRGDYFVVRDGDITIPEGGHICMYALQNLLPVITPKERAIAEAHDEDWMWRVRHVQCPDPKGRVIFTIDQVRKLEDGPVRSPESEARPSTNARGAAREVQRRGLSEAPAPGDVTRSAGGETCGGNGDCDGCPRDLRVVVEHVKGKCTSQMKQGDWFALRGGRLYIPAGRAFCLYALHAALPLLPAKQRRLLPGDWMAEEHRVICPDPAGNVILRIEPLDRDVR